MKSALFISLFILLCGLGGLIGFIWQDAYLIEKQIDKKEHTLTELPAEIELPKIVSNEQGSAALASASATGVLIQDRQSGAVVFAKSANQLRYPASTAKMMTAIIARKLYDLDDVLTVREEAFAEGTAVGFEVGEQFKVRDLLAALLLHSGNDAAFVFANNTEGGYDQFVKMMNEEAQKLGLEDTTFVNPSGLDDESQQSTAADLAKLGEALLSDSFLAELVKTKRLTIRDTSGVFAHQLINRNELLEVIPGVFGIKTGTTESAGENLVTAVRRGDREFLIVLLGSQARYIETLQALHWIDDSLTWETRKAPAIRRSQE
jgi:serine-type D-Ala-D-Ala carboxypeptidase (penicillin-binding protein 5/6)